MAKTDSGEVTVSLFPFYLLNLMGVKILIGFIRIYKFFLSPLWPGSCRFYPTCSDYSQEALRRYGIVKGLYLTFRRILRCNPFNPGGYDPV